MKRAKPVAGSCKAFKIATMSAAAAVVSLFFSTCAMPGPPTRTALVYGVSRYDIGISATSSPNLSYTDDDAISMAVMLREKGWDVIEGIADSPVDAENTDASRLAIETAISSLAGAEGLVLFYYSGHGSIYNGESVIIPYGTIDLESEWITVSDLLAMFKDAGLKNVIVILDSCFSGGFVEEGATVDAVPPIFEQNTFSGDIAYTWFVNALGDSILAYLSYSSDSNYVVISAAGSMELSWESPSYEHGIFTYLVLQAEAGDADYDNDGYVTTTELYAFCGANFGQMWNDVNGNYLVEVTPGEYQYADYLPHLSGTAREYALWAAN